MTESCTAPTTQPGDTPLAALVRVAVSGLKAVAALAADAPCGLADRDLLAGLAGVEELGRLVDGLRVSFASEVDDRCTASYGGDGLATVNNFTSSAELIAAVTSVSRSTARRRVRMGRRVRPSVSVTGALIAGTFDHVGVALRAGLIGFDAAEAIVRPLESAARAGVGFTEELAAAEAQLVGRRSSARAGSGSPPIRSTNSPFVPPNISTPTGPNRAIRIWFLSEGWCSRRCAPATRE